MARVALVTGGTRGIGAAISKALKAAGYKVAASYAGNDAAAEKFKGETGIPVYKWDVSSFDACAAGIKKVEADLGPVDVLVNNAGIGHVGNLIGTTVADLDRLYAVNVRGVFNGCKAFAPPMMERDSIDDHDLSYRPSEARAGTQVSLRLRSITSAGIHGSRIGSLRSPSGMII